MICNPSECKEIIFRKKGFIQDIAQVNNISQYRGLPIFGVMFSRRIVDIANTYVLSCLNG